MVSFSWDRFPGLKVDLLLMFVFTSPWESVWVSADCIIGGGGVGKQHGRGYVWAGNMGRVRRRDGAMGAGGEGRRGVFDWKGLKGRGGEVGDRLEGRGWEGRGGRRGKRVGVWGGSGRVRGL